GLPLEGDAAAGAIGRVRIFEREGMGVGVSEIEFDTRILGKGLDRWRGWRGAGRGVEVAHLRQVVSFAKAAFAEHFAVNCKPVVFGGRVREAVSRLDEEGVMAGRGRRDGAAP